MAPLVALVPPVSTVQESPPASAPASEISDERFADQLREAASEAHRRRVEFYALFASGVGIMLAGTGVMFYGAAVHDRGTADAGAYAIDAGAIVWGCSAPFLAASLDGVLAGYEGTRATLRPGLARERAELGWQRVADRERRVRSFAGWVLVGGGFGVAAATFLGPTTGHGPTPISPASDLGPFIVSGVAGVVLASAGGFLLTQRGPAEAGPPSPARVSATPLPGGGALSLSLSF